MFLQENDKIFWLHALLADILKNIRFSINQIIMSGKKKSYCF